jgi:hypothetical protein
MRMNPDPERDDTLLRAMLDDEAWQGVSAACKTEALRVFRVRQRIRRLTRWAGGAAALAAAWLVAVHWPHPPAVPLPKITTAHPAPPKPANQPRHLTDEQLLAAFPKGSCFIAEVDGRKELVFLDPKLQKTYVVEPSPRDN